MKAFPEFLFLAQSLLLVLTPRANLIFIEHPEGSPLPNYPKDLRGEKRRKVVGWAGRETLDPTNPFTSKTKSSFPLFIPPTIDHIKN